MFLDITDARFVGHGPVLAEKAKTKEGVIERKIGIVLLCNDRGFPMRWEVIAGKRPEPPAMHDVFDKVRGLDWVGDTPIVCDRIMGCSAELAKLLSTDVRFVTALRSNEWASYTTGVPHACIADLQPASEESPSDPCAEEAARRVMAAGMQCVSSTLYVLDLGVIERDGGTQASPPGARAPGTSPPGASAPEASAPEASAPEASSPQASSPGASPPGASPPEASPPEASPPEASSTDASQAMMLARQVDADQSVVGSLNAAARRLGITIGAAKGYRKLLKLGLDLQQEIIEGRARGVSIARLYAIAKLPEGEAQRGAFDRACSSSPSTAPSKRARSVAAATEPLECAVESICLRVRAVVAFNPELFVDQRRTAQKHRVDVQLFVRDLNERLARPRSKRTLRDIEAEIDRMLRRRNLLDAFKIRIDEHQTPTTPRYQVHAELDLARWQRRRRHDGFSVIIAHPAVVRTAGDLCQLYRSKDAVEKDFQIIKGLIRLRPIWHHTDTKVRAHVTLCMLALLLERTLNERLKHVSAEQAIETLSTCCLNRFQDTHGKSHYLVTQPDEAQQALLRELKLAPLAEDNDIVERLRPR
jgi:hypothetical protein